MLISKDQFLKFKSQFQIESLFNAILGGIIAFILMTAIYALIRPVNNEQFNQVVQLSKQQSFAETQEMALELLIQEKMSNFEFYRLMHAHHFESSRINQYPAMAIEDE